jgi:hypothetical protein
VLAGTQCRDRLRGVHPALGEDGDRHRRRDGAVSCFGQEDAKGDGLFDGISRWDNAVSNQSALFQMADGGMRRINEFRRIGISAGPSVRRSV